MRNISKKLLAVLMAVIMVMGAAPLSGVLAYADSVEEQTIAESEDSSAVDSFNSAELMTSSEPLAKEAIISHVIKAGETLTVDIIAGEITYIEFVPEKDGVYTFTSISDSDTYGYLYDENFNQLTSNDDGGDVQNFLIARTLTAGKSYYYGVKYLSSSSGSFDVQLTAVVIEDIKLDETLTADISSGDSSYFRFVPSTSGIYIFKAYVDSGAGISLYNSNLSSITSKYNENEGRNLQLAYYLYSGNTYYFRAQNYSTTDSIDVTVFTPGDDVIEAGETLTSDVDSGYLPFIKFVPDERNIYVFSLPSKEGANIYIYDSNLNLITSITGSGDGENIQLGDAFSVGYTYYLRAEGYSDYESIDITLTKAEKLDIELGETMTVDYIGSYTPYVRFVPETDGVYTVNLVCEDYTYHYLYDSEFYCLKSNSSSGESQISHYLYAGETYYFNAQDYYRNSESIEMSIVRSEDLVIEVDGTLTADIDSGCSSFIKFVPETDGMYVLSMSSESEAYAYLYDGGLGYITYEYADSLGADIQIAEYLYAGRTYYFRAERFSTRESVDVNLTKAEDLVIEAGDTLNVELYSGNSNFIKFIPEESNEYSFTVISQESVYVYLYDSTLSSLDYDYGNGTYDTAQIKKILVEGDTYYFRVYFDSDVDSVNVSLEKEECDVLETGKTVNADVTSGETSYIKFVPEESGEYIFTMPSISGSYIYLYDEYADYYITRYYDNGSNTEFQFSRMLVKGKTYYLKTSYYYSESIEISVEKAENIVIKADETLTVDFDSNYTPYVKFVPKADGKYVFTTEVSSWSYFNLYDAELNDICSDSGSDTDSFSAFLSADETYYFRAENRNGSESITLTVTEAENARIYDIDVNEILTVDVDSDGDTYVKFVPEADGTYILRSYSDYDPYCTLFNERNYWICNDYDSGYDQNFKLVYDFTAGETYYFFINFENDYDDNPISGSFDVKLSEICTHTVANSMGACDICGDLVFDYYVNDGCAVISDCDEYISGAVVIPETINGYTVDEVENGVFQNNNKITEIYLPKSVRYFDGLYDVPSLANVHVDEQSKYFTSVDGVVYSKNMKELVWFPMGRTETTYIIPDSVEKIGSYAFYEHANLVSVTIPASVNSIGAYAFYRCTALADAELPENLTYLGYGAFVGTALTEIVIPATIKEISSEAFENCDSLISVTISEGVESIDYDAFCNCSALTEIVIPASVKEIGSEAFENCLSLEGITILGTRAEFETDTFYGTAHYNNPNNWDIQNGVKLYYIDGYLASFDYTDYDLAPTELEIREGTKVIVNRCFQYSNFEKITLPEGLEYIGDNAFYECYSLAEINLPSGVELGDNVFYWCSNLATINAGSGIKGLDTDDLYGTAFLENKENYENGVLYLSDLLLKVDPETIQGEYTVKEGTNAIGEDAFANCLSLTSISIPSTVEFIGDGAFQFCATLKSVTIPEGVEFIGDNTFAGCLSLKEINIPSTVKEIGEYSFALCFSLESIELPAAVTVIPECAFIGCVNLKSAPINANTVAIGEGAFAVCAALTEVNIGAVAEEIGFTSFVGCSSVTKYTVDAANPVYESDSEGALYIVGEEDGISMKGLLAYPSASTATTYTMPEDVVMMAIPFVSCVNLESVDIPAEFWVNPGDGEFYAEEAATALAISAATMKLDINSLITLIEENVDDIVSLAYEILALVKGFTSEDEVEIVDAINYTINRVCDYIMGIRGVDDVYDRILGLLTDVLEAASLTTFKGFNISEDHPGLYDDDGVLYVTGDLDEDADEEKYLISCSASKEHGSNIFGQTTNKVDIDDGTEYIFPGAFLFCNLDKVTIPSTVTKLEMFPFAACNIGELTIPSSIDYIQEMSFALANISTLKIESEFIFEDGHIDDMMFLLMFADEVVLPKSLETIPEWAFVGCMAKSYDLPSNLKYIEEYAFCANIFLESIDVPNNTEYIGEGAFAGCIKLKEVDFNSQIFATSKLNTIGDMAFILTSVEEFNIPQNVENIGVLALNPSVAGGINYIASVLMPGLEEILKELEAEGYHIDTNKVEPTLRHVASWFTRSTGVTVSSRNRNFKAVDGDLYSYDMTKLIKVAETKSGLYEIPSTVMTISSGAFAFTGVRDVYIPDSVVTLESGAFAYSLISEIALGAGVREIPGGAFSGCIILDRVTILPTVVSIDEDAFVGCPDDLTIVGYAYSYAHDFAIENEINFVTIDGTGYVSIKAPSEIASAKVPVYGNTLANKIVEIFANGIKVGDAVSEENGYWRTTVEIPEPINNTVYSITAKIDAGTEKEVESAPVLVTYSTTVPAFESITCYHGSQSRTVTMENIGKIPEHMSFSSYTPFTYEIKLSAYDGSKTLYVVSGSYRIPAVYDAKTDTYIATGYFDDISKSYVPEYVTLELDGCTLANTSFRFPFIIDPSGFIYEAVHSNRIEGATVSIFFRDENGLAQLWNDAFIYGQESSIITGIDGLFEWDVPNGFWQVKAEKENYETGFSDWLEVPPEHTDVYIGLITKLTPNVKYVNGYSDGIDVTFDQYMDMSTVNSDNIVVTDESGDVVEGTWTPVNPEESGKDSSVYYATTFKFTPYSTLDGNYTVTVEDVENYADKVISVPYITTVTVKQRVETLAAPESITLVYGNEYADSDENKIILDGGIGAAGLTVNVALKDNFYVESVTTVTFDENGKATIEINPSRPGITTISFNLDGTDLVEETEIIVAMPEETRVTGVTLSDETAELQKGAEKQISAYVAPDFATDTSVTWSSSDNSIATVDEDGIIKGVKVGTANITVTTVDGGFTASCAVNVVPASYIVTWVVDGVEQTQTLYAGETITAPDVPEKDGYEFKGWTPDVPSVMPEENLTFTAIYEKLPVIINVTGVTLPDSSAELLAGAEKQLSANVAPVSATNTAVVWSSSDSGIAIVSENGLVKAVKAGTATITVTTVDGGFTASCIVNVKPSSYTVKWIVEGVEQTQTVAVGGKITAPDVLAKDGYEFKGWTPAIPETMPANDLTFTAVFEKIAEPDVPSEPVKEDIIIDPSETTIKYGDAIILNVDTTKIPEGGRVEWTVDNESYFNRSPYGETSYRLDPNKSGTVTVTATIYDAEDNAVSTDTQTMTSKAGFFDKIIAFFKRLFGLTKVITQAFKGVF